MIKENFKIDYTLQHVSNLLAKIEYTLQRPRMKDPRQDLEKVQKWKEEELKELQKEATTEGRLFFYADESSFLLNPLWYRTYAPKGHPPIVPIWDKSFNYISVCAAIGQHGEFVYTMNDKVYNGDKIVEFLKELLAKYPQPITLVWDGASVHFCKAVQSYLKTLPEGRLKLVKQPSYSPELNASEQLWNYAKNVDLKNRVFKSVEALKKEVKFTFDKFNHRAKLITQFFKHPSVAFY